MKFSSCIKWLKLKLVNLPASLLRLVLISVAISGSQSAYGSQPTLIFPESPAAIKYVFGCYTPGVCDGSFWGNRCNNQYRGRMTNPDHYRCLGDAAVVAHQWKAYCRQRQIRCISGKLTGSFICQYLEKGNNFKFFYTALLCNGVTTVAAAKARRDNLVNHKIISDKLDGTQIWEYCQYWKRGIGFGNQQVRNYLGEVASIYAYRCINYVNQPAWMRILGGFAEDYMNGNDDVIPEF